MSIVVPPVIGLAGLATGRRVRAASLLDLTFGRQILGNCWLCRASMFPKRAWGRRNGIGSIITKLCMKRHAGCFV